MLSTDPRCENSKELSVTTRDPLQATQSRITCTPIWCICYRECVSFVKMYLLTRVCYASRLYQEKFKYKKFFLVLPLTFCLVVVYWPKKHTPSSFHHLFLNIDLTGIHIWIRIEILYWKFVLIHSTESEIVLLQNRIDSTISHQQLAVHEIV